MKLFKRIPALLISAAVALSFCSCERKGTETEYGFTDSKNGKEYVYCAMLGVYAHGIEDEYIKVGADTYYTVEFEDPEEFLAVPDSGEYLLVRSKDTEEPTVENFDAIAAEIYNSGNTTYIASIYADSEYLPESLQDAYNPQNSYLCRLITQALVEGDSQYVQSEDISTENMYFIRLLSAKYPGLYYVVVFFGDTSGRYYLYDRAAQKMTLCPSEVTAFMVG